jgi:Ca-activated chloride channel family protein
LIAIPVLLAAGVLFLLWRERRARRRLETFADAGLAARLVAGHSRRRFWIKNSLLLLGFALLFLSLARPQWGVRWEKAESRGIDILFALDTSRSMLAEDVTPNRLERSKLAILDLLEKVRGDRVGLVAFAGEAFLQCPLTLDYQAFRQTLTALDTQSIPSGGTDVAAAIDEAAAYFEESENTRLLLLLTDGEDLEAEGVARAREAAGDGIRILTVGVGSPRGELIPITGPDGERDYLRDETGDPVQSALDEETLRRVASVTKGIYAPLGPTSRGLEEVYAYSLQQMEARERSETLQRIPVDRFQWPLLAAIFLLLLEPFLPTRSRRREKGTLPAASLLAFLALLAPANGLRAENPATAAENALREGRFEEALPLFREAVTAEEVSPRLHYNMGIAAYRSGEWESAVNAFTRALENADAELQSKSFFNAGNSRTALGFAELEAQPTLSRDAWQAALRDYAAALELRPDWEKAVRNRERLQEVLREHTHRLTLVAEPEEAGSVSGSGRIFAGIPRPVSATANPGWQFARWEGPVEDPEALETSVALTEDTTLTARFRKVWELTVVSADPEMGTAGTSGTYAEGEPVPIKAEAKDDFAFSKWKGEGVEVAEPEAAETEVTLDQNATVTATFVPAFKLDVGVEPEIGGQAGPAGFHETYSVVPLRAEPREGFRFLRWEGEGPRDPASAETTLTMIRDRDVTAVMEREWNLVLVPVPEEGGQLEGGGDHPVGSTVEIKAAAAEGYAFAGWDGPGVAHLASAATSVTVQSEAHTVFARFRPKDNEQENQQQQQENQQQQQENQQQQEQDGQEQQQEPQEEEQTGEPNQPGEDPAPQQQPDEEETREQQQESQPQQEQEAQEGEQVAQPAENRTLTREEARQLLRALREEERFLPAGERSREEGRPGKQPSGRDW